MPQPVKSPAYRSNPTEPLAIERRLRIDLGGCFLEIERMDDQLRQFRFLGALMGCRVGRHVNDLNIDLAVPGGACRVA